jgi:alkyl hydroperoxide reductase subunit AhpC
LGITILELDKYEKEKTGVSTALHHLHVKWNHLILDDQSLAVPVIGDRKKYKFV